MELVQLNSIDCGNCVYNNNKKDECCSKKKKIKFGMCKYHKGLYNKINIIIYGYINTFMGKQTNIPNIISLLIFNFYVCNLNISFCLMKKKPIKPFFVKL